MKTKFTVPIVLTYSILFHSCAPNPVTTAPTEKEPQPSISTSSLFTENIPLIDLNSTLPEDVLEEVRFYGGGGGGVKYCAPVSQPEICESTAKANWPDGFWISSHSWKENESITVTVTLPDLTQIINTGQSYPSQELFEQAGEVTWIQNYRYDYHIVPSWENMLGEYTIMFDGTSGHVEVKVLISISSQPHMSILSPASLSTENKIILTGFLPNEKIRLFAYTIDFDASEETLRFLGWNSYAVDNDGILAIDTSAYAEYYPYYFVAGEDSGFLTSLKLKESIIIP